MTRFAFDQWLRLCKQNRRDDLVGVASRYCSGSCCTAIESPEELVAHVRASHAGDVEPYVFAIRVAAVEWARSHSEHERAAATSLPVVTAAQEVSNNRSLAARGVAS